MMNMIMGSYLCSALMTGGFDAHVESWTYLNKTLVVAGLWAVLRFIAKAFDGVIDLPLAANIIQTTVYGDSNVVLDENRIKIFNLVSRFA